MPVSYLAKVLQPMAKAGLVSAQRGLGGGYVLERDASELKLLDVVNAVEPVQRIRSCPLKISSHGSRLCALHQALDDTMAAVEKSFSELTIGQLLARNSEIHPLCEVTPAIQQLGIPSRKSASASPDSSGTPKA